MLRKSLLLVAVLTCLAGFAGKAQASQPYCGLNVSTPTITTIPNLDSSWSYDTAQCASSIGTINFILGGMLVYYSNAWWDLTTRQDYLATAYTAPTTYYGATSGHVDRPCMSGANGWHYYLAYVQMDFTSSGGVHHLSSAIFSPGEPYMLCP